ncbi:Transcription activator BRG1 [Ranunculus cassubicifolius]
MRWYALYFGLGKTLQTISFLGFLSEFKGITGPHLVVVPFAVVENWIDEIRECCPTLHVVKFVGKQDQRVSQSKLGTIYLLL